MTHTEFYKDEYARLERTKAALEAIAEEYKKMGGADDLQPVVYWCSRIKSPESMLEKLTRYALPQTLGAALEGIYDTVGLRIVCSFASDVMHIVESLEAEPALELIEKKDYLTYPKPNGYRSIHLRVRLRETGCLAEIQVRTIAMDCWATLEHQIKYKKNVADDALIKAELKRCADEIASTDLSMQTIREILKDI